MPTDALDANTIRAPRISPAVLAAELDSMTDALERLAGYGPNTLTLQQAIFFIAVARRDLRHQRVTMAQIRTDHPALGRSIEKSKDILLEPTRSYPQAVSWLTQEHDPEDRRVRYLRLTQRGLEVLTHAFGN
jgi:DNA-binding MarR family transcriptional regulator